MKTTKNKYKPNYNRFLVAFNTSNGFYDFVFHLGYQQFVMPRAVRKVLAKTKLHRLWFSGFTGLGILSIDDLPQFAFGEDADCLDKNKKRTILLQSPYDLSKSGKICIDCISNKTISNWFN